MGLRTTWNGFPVPFFYSLTEGSANATWEDSAATVEQGSKSQPGKPWFKMQRVYSTQPSSLWISRDIERAAVQYSDEYRDSSEGMPGSSRLKF